MKKNAKTVINIKADKEIKENAQKIAEELGLSLSDVINASLRNFIRTRTVIFSSIPRMNKELENILRVSESDFLKGVNISPALSSSEEVKNFLDSLD